MVSEGTVQAAHQQGAKPCLAEGRTVQGSASRAAIHQDQPSSGKIKQTDAAYMAQLCTFL
jgi:hypothetical protein